MIQLITPYPYNFSLAVTGDSAPELYGAVKVGDYTPVENGHRQQYLYSSEIGSVSTVVTEMLYKIVHFAESIIEFLIHKIGQIIW